MLVVIKPAGPVHTVTTVTGISTIGLNSTAQVTVTSDPTGRIGLSGTLVTVTDVGDGTDEKELIINKYHNTDYYYTIILTSSTAM